MSIPVRSRVTSAKCDHRASALIHEVPSTGTSGMAVVTSGGLIIGVLICIPPTNSYQTQCSIIQSIGVSQHLQDKKVAMHLWEMGGE